MKNKRKDSIDGYLYALDGIRAVSLLLIYIFHLWQQSWIFYRVQIGDKTLLDLTIWQRYGYIAIDIFFVISGFCLFYPIAREMFGECKHTTWKQFYIKRARRIIPGYYFVLIMLLIFPVFSYGVSASTPPGELLKHYGLHALFLHIYNNSTAGTTAGTAWTLGVEAAFYLVFPLAAAMFKKHPIGAFFALFALGQGTRLFIAANLELTQVAVDFPLGYADIFGAGMLSAYFTVMLRNRFDMKRTEGFMTVISVLLIMMIYFYTKWMGSAKLEGYDAQTYHRLLYRFILAWSAAALILTSVYSIPLWSRIILGNRVFVFLSSISYSFFLWHQNIHIMLKELNIPHSDMNPVMNDKKAMIGFSLLSITLSLAISVFSTYVIERPIAKYGFKGAFLRIFKRS
ncbi:MAG: acyltransferase [Clostridiales bacterium]|nr:acyltransferase [Clostridiales bacterium]